ncbi:MAG: putative Fe-S cluster assembly protein SufT [Chlamydiae bacterium]|nr:putative Fe-S cluster assembly protein SufT [Chlamydiota bacterium]MBI3276270.1 putative Fe-S cluster assembly protein SufT [Chlamydiota bacterium]
MQSREPIELKRACEAIEIPAGTKIILPAAMKVMISQTLGGSYTVITDRGAMVRISGRDADALGLEIPVEAEASSGEEPLEKRVFDQLRTCYDPEIPVNILELGLVYDCKIIPLSEGNRVEIKMTLTAPGCGMGTTLSVDVKQKIESIPGVREADVQLVWDPPWTMDRMSEAAKLQLGMM